MSITPFPPGVATAAHAAKPDEFLTVAQVATRYRCTAETVYRHTRAGTLPFTKVAGKLLFSLRALEAHEARNTNSAA